MFKPASLAATLALGLAVAPLPSRSATVPTPALNGPTLIADVSVLNLAGSLFDAVGPVLFLEAADGTDIPLDATLSISGFTDTGFLLSVYDNTSFASFVEADSVAVHLDGTTLAFGFKVVTDTTGLFGSLVYASLTGLFPDDLFDVDYDEDLVSAFVTTATVAPVPLPLTAPLLVAGLGALGLVARRRGASRA